MIIFRSSPAQRATLLRSDPLAFVSVMTSAIVHEIYSPLEGMHINLQLQERQISKQQGLDGAPLLGTTRRIRAEVERLMSVLEAFQSAASLQELHLDATSLSDLVQETLVLERAKYAQKGIRIVIEFENELPLVFVDQARLKQTILTLCHVAAVTLGSGGGERCHTWLRRER